MDQNLKTLKPHFWSPIFDFLEILIDYSFAISGFEGLQWNIKIHPEHFPWRHSLFQDCDVSLSLHQNLNPQKVKTHSVHRFIALNLS